MSKKDKAFDAVAMMRSARDELSERLEGMTLEEQLAWLAAQDLGDPMLERLRAKAGKGVSKQAQETREAGPLSEP